jgi:excisionase family DNA binding protein
VDISSYADGVTDPGDLLTVAEVAARLQMTTDGVYKLIQRGKLKATRVSERKTRVPSAALAEYEAVTQAWVERYLDESAASITEQPEVSFTATTGMTPEAWLAAWKRDEIKDSTENMQLLAHAAALVSKRTATAKPAEQHTRTPVRSR